MPVKKKEIELSDSRKVWFRQASGMDKLKIESIQAKVFRKCRDFGSNPADWTEEQQEQFSELLDEAGGGVQQQIETWIPKCCIDEDFDINLLTSEELRSILSFVRGDDDDGAVPLD
tara:strand:- start:1877 stop:2224 length:348 start_codon:yes stop_codon:yes gene_type:complete